jgi:hypothetical protein
MGIEHVPARSAFGIGIGFYARPVQADRAIAEDREVKDVAVGGVFYNHLGLQYRCGKISIGHCLLIHPSAGWGSKTARPLEHRAHDL